MEVEQIAQAVGPSSATAAGSSGGPIRAKRVRYISLLCVFVYTADTPSTQRGSIGIDADASRNMMEAIFDAQSDGIIVIIRQAEV